MNYEWEEKGNKIIFYDVCEVVGTDDFYGFEFQNKVKVIDLANIEEIRGNSVFANLKTLKRVISKKLRIVGPKAFENCESLEVVENRSPNSTATIDRVGESAFKGCKALQTVDLSSATSVGNSAFSGCESLKKVNLSSVPSVGNSAFSGCKALQTVALSSATSIGEYAFSYCGSLMTVNLGSATSIGKFAFRGCKALQTVDLSSATSIGNSAFSDCKALKEAALRSATSVGDGAFSRCTSLEKVNLRSAEHIGRYAFDACFKLKDVTLANENNLPGYYYYFNFKSANNNKIKLNLGAEVFNKCFGLLKEKVYATLGSFQNEKKTFKFNDGMQTLPGDCPKFIFNSKDNIEEVDLGELQELPNYYFNGCRNLKK